MGTCGSHPNTSLVSRCAANHTSLQFASCTSWGFISSCGDIVLNYSSPWTYSSLPPLDRVHLPYAAGSKSVAKAVNVCFLELQTVCSHLQTCLLLSIFPLLTPQTSFCTWHSLCLCQVSCVWWQGALEPTFFHKVRKEFFNACLDFFEQCCKQDSCLLQAIEVCR